MMDMVEEDGAPALVEEPVGGPGRQPAIEIVLRMMAVPASPLMTRSIRL